ncbi:MAG: protein-disulfide reductase DsbD family protein, partial [Flavobacteriales bacterium]
MNSVSRKFSLVFFLFVFASLVQAQVVDPCKWKTKIEQKKPGEATLIITATLDNGWHLYSQQEYTDGPLPTVFEWPKCKTFSLVGKTSEPEGKEDHMWAEQDVPGVMCFENIVVFKQKIKFSTTKKFEIICPVSYMVCQTSCMPGDAELKFTINPTATQTQKCNDNTVEEDTIEIVPMDTSNNNPSAGNGFAPVGWRFLSKRYNDNDYLMVIRAQIDTGWFLPSLKNKNGKPIFTFNLPEGVLLADGITQSITPTKKLKSGSAFEYTAEFTQHFKNTKGDSTLMKNVEIAINYIVTDGKRTAELVERFDEKVDMSGALLEVDPKNTSSYWAIFITAFLSGFLALLTPCVFPMIPMTVSFFLKRSKDRKKSIANALIYGLSIIVIYVTLGIAVTAAFGSDSLNAMSTDVLFNLFFFILLVVFAVSFLGAFEITLPSSWVNAADKGADKGGLIGIFFMAFTLALVSFSCTGPIVGTLLVEAAQKGGMGPFWGMLGFSLAIALPFALFALFPSLLKSIPSSGGWLNTVKVSLGFFELALAFKFLSNADLVVQAHLLEREVFIAIWIVIFSLWAFYLLGKIKMPHDSDLTHLSVGRISWAILIFSFVIYLIPGMWGAPLKLISGFPPPLHYSESPYGIGGKAPEGKGDLPEHAVYGPHQLITFHDYKYALEYAKKVNKPLLLDFTGHACVNCRQMEERVWSSEIVLPLMRNEMVIASLHVDEKTQLPESEQYTSKTTRKKIRSVGNKWSDLQIAKYKTNTQPQYLLLDQYEQTLNGSANYQHNGSPGLFEPWLKEGIKRYKEFKGSKEYRPAMKI